MDVSRLEGQQTPLSIPACRAASARSFTRGITYTQMELRRNCKVQEKWMGSHAVWAWSVRGSGGRWAELWRLQALRAELPCIMQQMMAVKESDGSFCVFLSSVQIHLGVRTSNVSCWAPVLCGWVMCLCMCPFTPLLDLRTPALISV